MVIGIGSLIYFADDTRGAACRFIASLSAACLTRYYCTIIVYRCNTLVFYAEGTSRIVGSKSPPLYFRCYFRLPRYHEIMGDDDDIMLLLSARPLEGTTEPGT